ncbi:hypothetical protein BD410DRAFT_847270, partial [Rickenella mellea]
MPPTSSSRLSPEEMFHTSSGLSPEEVSHPLVPQLRQATWDDGRSSADDNSQSNSDHDMEGDCPSGSDVVPPGKRRIVPINNSPTQKELERQRQRNRDLLVKDKARRDTYVTFHNDLETQMRAAMTQDLEKRTEEIKAQALAQLDIIKENFRAQMESRLAALEDEHQTELQNLQVEKERAIAAMKGAFETKAKYKAAIQTPRGEPIENQGMVVVEKDIDIAPGTGLPKRGMKSVSLEDRKARKVEAHLKELHRKRAANSSGAPILASADD